MLRKIRITLAALVFVAITLLLLDFTDTLLVWLEWLGDIQFLPALLALNAGVLAVLVILTLLLGRIYCSVICPLGVMQDIVSWIHGKTKKNRFSYSPAISWLRYTMLGSMVVAFVAGVGSFVALLAPYSTYGRIVINLFQPIYMWANNGLAAIAEHYESYAFYSVDVWMKSLPTFIITLVVFIAIVVLAWRGGRTYCNTICPVGTVLAQLARFSWFKVVIDTDKCRDCGLCSKNCKASCIDIKNHKVDYTRCVTCGNCLEKCNFGALTYAHKKAAPVAATASEAPKADTSRRAMLVGAAIVGADVALAQAKKKVDGGLAAIADKQEPKRSTRITPPGSVSARNMATRCTACQLCVSACPCHVLRPSGDLMTLMQPYMSYERGYCRPECNRCSQLCPSGAIKPLGLDEKVSTQIGHAVWIKKNCVAVTDGVSCGNCARHCPSGAITMVPLDEKDENSPFVPAINTEKCIGCGACEYLCPARPYSAIYVEGHEQHRTI